MAANAEARYRSILKDYLTHGTPVPLAGTPGTMPATHMPARTDHIGLMAHAITSRRTAPRQEHTPRTRDAHERGAVGTWAQGEGAM